MITDIQLIETLLWTRGGGYHLLEGHLERLAAEGLLPEALKTFSSESPAAYTCPFLSRAMPRSAAVTYRGWRPCR